MAHKNTRDAMIARFCSVFSLQRPYFWMMLACAIWLWAFRSYIFGQTALFSDATSYYDHSRFFVENIKRGVFPLWDSFWNFGAPNEFFLRRIGCYNPIYLWVILFNFLGFSYSTSYLLMLSFYFFLGTFGLYLLAKVIYKDERVAFVAFLLLLFSMVGVRTFDSYMCLVIVPTIWFFYFAYTFLIEPRRMPLVGLVASLIIVFNTYIPLFFITIVLAVTFFWVVIFPKEALAAARRVKGFVIKNLMFSLAMGVIIILAFIPPLLIFMSVGQGGMVMPERHGASSAKNVLAIDTKLLNWGVMEDLVYTTFFLDFRKFMFALVYVPFLTLVLWILGTFCRINRRILLYFAVGIPTRESLATRDIFF